MSLCFFSRLLGTALSIVVVAGCAEKSVPAADEQAQHVAEVAAAGGVVDSILPIAEHLRRFRASMPKVDTLSYSSPNREALVDRWANAIGANDTTDLNAMIMNRTEFAWLYYTDSPMSRPPYEAPPELLWGQLLASSNKGATQLVGRFGGSRVTASRLRCTAPPDTQGANVLYSKCEVRLSAPGKATVDGVMFGTILERDGRFKFVGLSSKL